MSHEAQFHTLVAHRSNIQTRLVATFDALDELQSTHTLEIGQLHQQVHKLREKARASKARAKAAEAERDEMREDVEKLVEKGGRIVDFLGVRVNVFLPTYLCSPFCFSTRVYAVSS